jgi:hypothetical protein
MTAVRPASGRQRRWGCGPVAEDTLDEREGIIRRDIAADHEHRVVGPVPARMKRDDVVARERRERLGRPRQRMTVRRLTVGDAIRDESREGAGVAVGESEIAAGLGTHTLEFSRREHRCLQIAKEPERGLEHRRRRANADN